MDFEMEKLELQHKHYYDMFVYWINMITDKAWERRGRTKEEAEQLVEEYYRKMEVVYDQIREIEAGECL